MITRRFDSIQEKMLPRLLVIVLVLSLLSACNPGGFEPAPVVRAAPAASATELAEPVAGNTAAVVLVSGDPPDAVTVTVDRPFLFLIQDLQTGTILFLGRVVDPGGSMES